jgi:hypothetical protein
MKNEFKNFYEDVTFLLDIAKSLYTYKKQDVSLAILKLVEEKKLISPATCWTN